MSWVELLVTAASASGAALITLAGVPVFRRWALTRGVLDQPNDRSLHTVPTVRGAGVVMACAVLAGMAVSAILLGRDMRLAVIVASGGAIIAAVGWWDDRFSLSPLQRLAVQTAVATGVVVGIGSPQAIGLFGTPWIPTAPAGPMLSVLWVVAVVNFYNFMDGIDGLAAGQAAVAGLAWFVAAMLTDHAGVAAMSLTTCLGALAFLKFNWSPATVFMGDSGSGFLGYMFAVMPLVWAQAARHHEFPVEGAAFIGLFLFDASLTLLQRLHRRERVWQAHRSHHYQRLVAAGCSHAEVSLRFLLLAALAAFPAALQSSQPSWLFAVGPALVASVCLWGWTHRASGRGRRSDHMGTVGAP